MTTKMRSSYLDCFSHGAWKGTCQDVWNRPQRKWIKRCVNCLGLWYSMGLDTNGYFSKAFSLKPGLLNTEP